MAAGDVYHNEFYAELLRTTQITVDRNQAYHLSMFQQINMTSEEYTIWTQNIPFITVLTIQPPLGKELIIHNIDISMDAVVLSAALSYRLMKVFTYGGVTREALVKSGYGAVPIELGNEGANIISQASLKVSLENLCLHCTNTYYYKLQIEDYMLCLPQVGVTFGTSIYYTDSTCYATCDGVYTK